MYQNERAAVYKARRCPDTSVQPFNLIGSWMLISVQFELAWPRGVTCPDVMCVHIISECMLDRCCIWPSLTVFEGTF